MKKIISVLLAVAIVLSLVMPAAAPVQACIQDRYVIGHAVEILKKVAGLDNMTTDSKSDYDLNFDGKVNIDDAVMILKSIAGIGTLPKRCDNEICVDCHLKDCQTCIQLGAADILADKKSIVSRATPATSHPSKTACCGDVNLDGRVDVNDFIEIMKYLAGLKSSKLFSTKLITVNTNKNPNVIVTEGEAAIGATCFITKGDEPRLCDAIQILLNMRGEVKNEESI